MSIPVEFLTRSLQQKPIPRVDGQRSDADVRGDFDDLGGPQRDVTLSVVTNRARPVPSTKEQVTGAVILSPRRELYVQPTARHRYADEGSYYAATTDVAIPTGIQLGCLQTFDDTAAVLALVNTAPIASSLRVYLDYIQFLYTFVSTTTNPVSMQFCVRLDNVPRISAGSGAVQVPLSDTDLYNRPYGALPLAPASTRGSALNAFINPYYYNLALPSLTSLCAPLAFSATEAALVDANVSFMQSFTWSGSSWSRTGTASNMAGTGPIQLPTGAGLSWITALSASRIAYIDDRTRQLRTYDKSASGAWGQTGTGLAIATFTTPIIAALSSTRVALVDNTNKTLVAYDWNGTTWAQVGNAFALVSATFPVITALTASTVAYCDSTNIQLRTYSFDGTNWTLVGAGLTLTGIGFPAITAMSATRIAIVDSTLLTISAYDWSGAAWSLVGSALAITSGSAQTLTALSGSDVAMTDGGSVAGTQQLRTYTFNGATWAQSGTGYNPVRYLTSSTTARTVGRCSAANNGPVNGDKITLQFGRLGGGDTSRGSTAGRAVASAAVTASCPPVIIGPGQTCLIHMWWPGVGLTWQPQQVVSLGWWER